jgi:hypothetical protein
MGWVWTRRSLVKLSDQASEVFEKHPCRGWLLALASIVVSFFTVKLAMLTLRRGSAHHLEA